MIRGIGHAIETTRQLDFLWLELTNRCNLECVHCYAESSPRSQGADILSYQDYSRILTEARETGCQEVQFIGGEPTLNPALVRLIEDARRLGYSLVEVYSNLVSLPSRVLDVFAQHSVSVATSVYGHTAYIHEGITCRSGSFRKTVTNIRRVLQAGLPLRASIVVMDKNEEAVEETRAFLFDLGVAEVGIDRVRKFGRALEGTDSHSEISELCGSCAGGTLCVGPDGVVAPCIMSKSWSVGSVRESTISKIVGSAKLRNMRKRIYDSVYVSAEDTTMCTPDRPSPCQPDYGSPCFPCSPNTNCGPNDCRPKHGGITPVVDALRDRILS